MSRASRAVFLSYASEDAAPAQRIADALRAAGIDVWFDQSELRGGDAWDRKIRREIHDCALFMPVISAHSDARHEGYFRREWRLAVERAGDMAEDVPFLLPVVIDATKDIAARVPDRFRDVQWSHLPEGEPSAAFIEWVQRLLSPAAAPSAQPGATARSVPSGGDRARVWSRGWVWGAAAVAAVAAGYFAFERLAPKHGVPDAVAPVSTPARVAASFSPPAHSIAVLPFVNMSGDKNQEYFSDGLSEELLNSLARINELQVAARTSSFYFKGKDVDLNTIARKLNVASVLEGSVRRSGHTIRITAQLNNAVTGYHLWSDTYDRDLKDVLTLQTEIATAVANSLKVALLSDVSAKIELGGTHNADAFDAYLHGSRALASYHDEKDLQASIDAYTEAIRLDPRYALAFAGRADAMDSYAGLLSPTPQIRGRQFDQVRDDANQAVALAPELGTAHLALARYFESGALDFTRASEEYERALALAPGDASVLRSSGYFAVRMGHTEAGLRALRRAVVLDPLARASHRLLADALLNARQYEAALAAAQDALAIDPNDPYSSGLLGTVYYVLGRFEAARESCLRQPDYWLDQQCLVLVYDRLGQRADAEAALKGLQALQGDNAAYQYGEIFAQRGRREQALTWLETALRLHDPGLYSIKVDPFLDSLRHEPRFQAIERALKFPN